MNVIALALAAATAVAAAAGPAEWLDAPSPANWNVAGAALPHAPGPADPDLRAGGTCARVVRAPEFPEDTALVRAGWSLVGQYQRFGGTSIVLAAASADGMCRPNEYNSFVFVRGRFAGTLSPRRMDARTDASLSNSRLSTAGTMSADFARYTADDPLCCPSGTTYVDYHVNVTPRGPVVAPDSTYQQHPTPAPNRRYPQAQ